MLKETPYWWDTAPELPKLAIHSLPAKTDVVIVGSGYTGLSAARVGCSSPLDVQHRRGPHTVWRRVPRGDLPIERLQERLDTRPAVRFRGALGLGP